VVGFVFISPHHAAPLPQEGRPHGNGQAEAGGAIAQSRMSSTMRKFITDQKASDASSEDQEQYEQDTPPRLLSKRRVLARIPVPTPWTWMRAGKFPRAKDIGGKSVWLASEVEEWIAALPLRKLKGDEEAA